jgi:hypothetical protein
VAVGTFVWVDLAAAILLALWVIVRHPELGPRSFRWAAALFVLGQVVAQLGSPLVAPVVQLPHGTQLVLLLVVFPVLFGVVLSSMWLVRALAGANGGAPSRSAASR